MKRNKRPILPQLLCGLALCFTMLIFAPIEMVTLNNINFWFSVKHFLPLFLGLFLAAFTAVELIFVLLRRLPYALWLQALSILLGVTLALYVQGNYLALGGEALLSGEPVWEEMRVKMLVNVGIWAAILTVCTALSLVKPKLFLKVVSTVSLLILVMEGTALISLMMGSAYNNDINHVYCSDEEQFTFSDNGDVIMIMLDSLDVRFVDRALQEDPDYAAVFEDFTYYRNTASNYSRTDTSFSNFMTGAFCYNEEPFLLHCRRAFEESRFFPVMKDAGMTLHVYGAPGGMFSTEQMQQVSNLKERKSQISDPVAFAKEMIYMVSYRYLPLALQPFMLRDWVENFAQLQQMENENLRQATDNNIAFVNKFHEEGVTLDSGHRFYKLFVLHGAHQPAEMNRFMEKQKSTQYEQALGCFALLSELFGELKEKGIYDKATILVFGDHGINDDTLQGLGSPALLVKYPGESGPMRTSMAPTMLIDMRATALYGAGISHEAFGTPVHEWEGVENRERYFLTYKYDPPNSYEYYLNWVYEYAVPADATDLAGYAPTGRIFKQEGRREYD